MAVKNTRAGLSLLLILVVSVGSLVGCADEKGNENFEPVELAITQPEDGGFVNVSRVRVRGTADGADEITVNDQKVEVAGGTWEVLLEFPEGPATVTASARDAEATSEFVVDTIAPSLELTSPERGLFAEEGQTDEVTVAGTVSDDGSGLKVFALGDVPINYDDQGAFSHAESLQPGYNELVVRAIDQAGNEATALRSILYGPMADATGQIDSAVQISLAPEALDTITEVIEALLTPQRVTGFVQNALSDVSNLSVDSVSFDSLDVTVTPHSDDEFHDGGYLVIEVHTTNFVVEGTASFGGSDYPTTITVDEATVRTEASLAATSDGQLDVSFSQSELDMADEDFHFAVQGRSDQDMTEDDSQFLRDMAVSAMKAAFSELLSDQLIDRLYDPEMLRRQVELLGRTLEFELILQQIRVSSAGVFIKSAVAIVSDRYPEVPEAPGALNLPLGPATTPKIEGDMLFSTHQTALDRLLHGVWRAGLLSLELAGSDFAGLELPVDLKASALAGLLDSDIADLEEPDTPAGIKLRPQLPPVVSLEPAATDTVGANLGELLVDLQLLPDGKDPTKVVTVALFLDVSATVEVRDGKLALSLDAQARADVADEPTVDLDDQKTEQLLVDMIELAVQMVGQEMELTAAVEMEWLTVENPKIEIHGEDDDQLSVAVDLVANPAGLQDGN